MWKSWVIITETKENFILDYLLLTILFRLLKFRSTQLERTATITTIPFEIETPVCWRSFPLVSKCLSRFLRFISPRSLIHKVRQTTWPFHVHSPAKSLSSLRSPFSFLPSFPPSSYPLFPFSLLVPFGGSLFSRYRSSSRSFSLMFENQPSSSLFSLPQCLLSFFIFASLSLSLSIDGNFQSAATPPVNVIHPVLWANSRALRNNLRPNGKRVDPRSRNQHKGMERFPLPGVYIWGYTSRGVERVISFFF